MELILPRPVQIPAIKFMEKDHEGRACWYEVTKEKCLQGLLASQENEYRLYGGTIAPKIYQTGITLAACYYMRDKVHGLKFHTAYSIFIHRICG